MIEIAVEYASLCYTIRCCDFANNQIPNLRVARSNRAGVTNKFNHLAILLNGVPVPLVISLRNLEQG